MEKKSFADYGYSHKPMLLEIPHANFMMCDLHILLRISEVLFNLLLRELAQKDKKVDFIFYFFKENFFKFISNFFLAG